MQFNFLIIAAALGAVANGAAVDARDLSALDKRAQLSAIDRFGSSGCNNYVTTYFTSSDSPGDNGECVTFSGALVPSVRVIQLAGGCTVTVYTDNSCSNGATAARLNSCVSGGWRSFSTDNSCSNGATAARLNSCVSGGWRSFSTDNCN